MFAITRLDDALLVHAVDANAACPLRVILERLNMEAGIARADLQALGNVGSVHTDVSSLSD
jgi:hypothetical protein